MDCKKHLRALFLLFALTAPVLAQVPAKVTLSRANSPTADGFTVAWSDLSNETAYHLEHTTSANFTTSTLITNISANATSHALTGLTPGTTYYVRVRGAAAGGNGTWSDVQANQLLSIDPGQTRYLSVAGVPHGASHSVNFTISDIFGSTNAAGLAAGTTSSEASTIMLLGSDGSTAHTVFYNSSQNQWREGATNKGSEIVGFGKGFMVKNNTGSADIFLLSGSIPPLEPGTVTVFPANAPAGRLSLVSPPRTMATSLRSLGLTHSNNTTTGLKRATTAKDADLLLIPDSAGGLHRYHFDGTNWRSGLRTVSDPSAITVPPGGAFFLRKASGSGFQQWRTPLDIVTNGLVLHLDAGHADSYPGSGTVWTDLSGNAIAGTLINGPTYNSNNGGNIVFDGSNDRFQSDASIPSINFQFNSGFTISSWCFITENSSTGYIASYRLADGSGTQFSGWGFGQNAGGIFGSVGGYPGGVFSWRSATTNTTTFNNLIHRKWANIVYVNTGTNGEQKIYANGIDITATSTQDPTPYTVNYTTNYRLRIGHDLDLFHPLTANISQVSIYNRALSAQEIRQNYDATKGRYEIVQDGLALHLDAGNTASYNGTGTLWRDLSASSNNGTLTNGPTFGSANGGRFSFDGSDDYVQLNSLWEWSIGSTVNVWIDLSQSSGDAKYFLGRIDSSNMGIRYNVNTQSFLIFDGLIANIQTISYSKPTGYILFSAIRLNANEYEYFVNGASIGIGTVSTSNTTISLNTIGRRSNGLNSDASIAAIMFYNRRLSISELQHNYNVLKRRFEDPAATAYLNAVEAADGQPLEAGVREAVDKFVKGCKADGIWTAIKASCILAGARTLNGTLTPLVGTAPTNYNFVSADYDRENGLQGGGSKYLDTNRDNNADPQNNKHYSVHIHTVHASGSAGTYIGYTSITSGASGVLRSAANPANIQFRINDNTVNNVAGGTATGFVGASRSNSSDYVVRYSSGNTTANVASQTPASGNFRVLSGLGFGCNGRLQFYSIGESLDLAKLDSRVTTLMADLAAAIP